MLGTSLTIEQRCLLLTSLCASQPLQEDKEKTLLKEKEKEDAETYAEEALEIMNHIVGVGSEGLQVVPQLALCFCCKLGKI